MMNEVFFPENLKLKPGEAFLDRFEILEILGYTHSTVAYKAHDKRIGRDLTIKLFQLQEGKAKGTNTKLIQDLTIAGRLVHPNIRLIYNSETLERFGYIAQEFLDGYSLRSVLNLKPVLRPEIATRIVMYICDALEYSHKNGIFHKHLSPKTIFITRKGIVKICDFGIRSFFSSSEVQLNNPHEDSELFLYQAPEIIEGGDDSGAADVFSLGITFYEMVCGRLPFPAQRLEDYKLKLKSFNFLSPQKLNPNISKDLEYVIVQSFNKEPGKRFESAELFKKRLSEFHVTEDAMPIFDDLDEITPHTTDIEAPVEQNGGAADIASPVKEERVIHIQRDEQPEEPENGGEPDAEPVGKKTLPDQNTTLKKKRSSVLLYVVLAVLFFGAIVAGSWFLYQKQIENSIHSQIAQIRIYMNEGKLISDNENNAFMQSMKLLDYAPENREAVEALGKIRSTLIQQLKDAQDLETLTSAVNNILLLQKQLPDDTEISALLAESEIKLKERTEEKEKLDRVAELLDDARIAIEALEWDKALELGKSALEIIPASSDVMLLLGSIYHQTGREDDALTALNQVIEQHPENVEAYLLLGKVYWKNEDLIKAEEAFRKSTELAPEQEDNHFYLATVLQLQGKRLEAIEEYRKETEFHESPISHFNLGYLLQTEGQLPEAIDAYRRAIELKPDLQAGYYNLAILLYKTEDMQGAKDVLDKVLEMDPDYYKAQNLLKKVEEKLK